MEHMDLSNCSGSPAATKTWLSIAVGLAIAGMGQGARPSSTSCPRD